MTTEAVSRSRHPLDSSAEDLFARTFAPRSDGPPLLAGEYEVDVEEVDGRTRFFIQFFDSTEAP